MRKDVPNWIQFELNRFILDLCERGKLDYDEWHDRREQWMAQLCEDWSRGVNRGLSDPDALDFALREFGNPREVARALRGGRMGWILPFFLKRRYRAERYAAMILSAVIAAYLEKGRQIVMVVPTHGGAMQVSYVLGYSSFLAGIWLSVCARLSRLPFVVRRNPIGVIFALPGGFFLFRIWMTLLTAFGETFRFPFRNADDYIQAGLLVIVAVPLFLFAVICFLVELMGCPERKKPEWVGLAAQRVGE